MDLVEIKDYEGLYSLDKNTNQVYNTKYNRYIKPLLDKYGYHIIRFYKNSKETKFKLHRLIYQIYYPDIDINNLCIDHIDNNTLNNNIQNLRHCNRSENRCNVKVHKNNLLGIKNISLTKFNTYQVHINKNKKKYSKTFKTLEEAIEYRNIKKKEIQGEFSNIN